jgi:cytochrome c oxidase cbb3-type subunit III
MIFGPAGQDQELGHGDDYDGIEEYDNALPAWWLGILYFSIAWAVAYGVHYHFVADRSQAAEYDAEIAAAATLWPAPADAADIEVGAEGIAAGKTVYDTNCAACHAADLTGGIGPSLVDDEWVHGRENIADTITDGVLEKGMPAWGTILGPTKVAQVAAYIDGAS